jgi:uncharacterized protein with NAD-binding domain and iron-sulfur cluster
MDMNGLQLYLRKDIPLARGHISYTDSAWALTSISQRQFWSHIDLSNYGDGTIRGILSVDISDWRTPGQYVVKKPPRECSAEEIFEETLAQLAAHLNLDGETVLDRDNVVHWLLDPAIIFPGAHRPNENSEPLLINTVDSWRFRPQAVTEIPNLFVASDYVRTHTDLATMESANEAARSAVNGILAESSSSACPCMIWPLEEPLLFAPLREYDAIRFKLGLPHTDSPGGSSLLELSAMLENKIPLPFF